MIKVFAFVVSIIVICAAAPRYGSDGGYQGYASYKPMSPMSPINALVGFRPREDIPLNSNSKYGFKSKEKYDILDNDGGPSSDYSVPKKYGALNHVTKVSSGYNNNQLLESPASSYGHAAVYGNDQGGYKLADAYSNDYSGSAYEEHDEYAHHHPQPYEFGYQVKDDYGNQQYKTEISDGQGKVKGSYGFTDEHGLYRKVEYVADKTGFHANVKTNEPGTGNQDPADVHIESSEEKY